VSTRAITRISLFALGLLAAPSAFAQNGNATLLAIAQVKGTPTVSITASNARGEVRPNPDPEYVRTVRRMLLNTNWLFLGNNTLLIVRDTEMLLTLRVMPGFDGSSWQVTSSRPIGTAMHSISGQIRRGVRNGGSFDPNRGTADLLLTTESSIGDRTTARLVIPLLFDTVTGGPGEVIDPGDFVATGAQGGVVNTGVPTETGATEDFVPDDRARRPFGWGVRLWPAPWK
jgi:hypothetical protein